MVARRLLRVSDGTRTRDHLDHNQELYLLSYAHHAGALSARTESSTGRSGHEYALHGENAVGIGRAQPVGPAVGDGHLAELPDGPAALGGDAGRDRVGEVARAQSIRCWCCRSTCTAPRSRMTGRRAWRSRQCRAARRSVSRSACGPRAPRRSRRDRTCAARRRCSPRGRCPPRPPGRRVTGNHPDPEGADRVGARPVRIRRAHRELGGSLHRGAHEPKASGGPCSRLAETHAA